MYGSKVLQTAYPVGLSEEGAGGSASLGEVSGRNIYTE